MARWCKLSILTDEVSQDLDEVLAFAREFQLDGIEVRSLWGKAFRDLTTQELKEMRHRCDDVGLQVSGCATPVFKCELESTTQRAEHLDLFRRSVEAAHLLGCSLVRVFTFLRRSFPSSHADLAAAASHFPELIGEAEKAGLILGVENEASCLAGTGSEMRDFLSHLEISPALGVVWDPCNVLFLPGESLPFPTEYEEVADRVVHLHVKDARRTGYESATECLPLGDGQADLAGQLKTLRVRGYCGWVTLETHWRETRLGAELQHLPAGHLFSQGGEKASRICMARLQSMVQ